MFAPVDFSHVENALATPTGWADLALVFASLALAWVVDQRVHGGSETSERARLHGGVARVVFPLTALILVVLATNAYQRFLGTPFFLSIAGPMLIALAAIRMLVYGLRRLFRADAWVRTSERAIAFAIWALLVLYFLGVLPEVVKTLDEIVIPIGKTSVSLLTIGTAIVVVVFTLVVTLSISAVIERRLDQATHLDVTHRAVVAKFVRALLLVVGVLFALQAIGFDLTLLSVFGGALGVGIGLGLQKLASNYIAGFTILMDRSVRLGDMVTVDGRFGTVSKVASRYVVIRSLDGVEAIVPNETVVTTTVLNHSYSTRNTRVTMSVQVSYDSDVERALALLEETARAQPRVLTTPDAPVAMIASFGDNGITLEVGFWINDPERGQGNIKGAINRALLPVFAQNGIRLPYPQRDVRIVAMPAAAGGQQAAATGTFPDLMSPGVAGGTRPIAE